MAVGDNTVQDMNYGGEINLTNFYKGIVGTFQIEQQKAEQREALEQKKIEQENIKIDELISSINPEGIRPIDSTIIANDIGVARDLAYKMYTADNEQDRLKYRAQIQSQLGKTKLNIDKSKTVNKTVATYGEEYRKNPYTWGDDFASNLSDIQNKNLNDLTTQDIDPQRFMRRVDGTKVTSTMDKIADDLLKRSDLPLEESQERTTIGARGATRVARTKQVPVDVYAKRLEQEYQGSGEMKAYIAQNYPDMTPQEAIMSIAQDRYNNGFLSERKEETILDPIPRAERSGSSREVAEAQYGVPIGFANTGTVASVYQPVKSQNVALSRATGVDLESGQPVSDITGEIDVSGLAKIPVLTKDVRAGGKTIPKGSIATPDFARQNPNLVQENDYFIGNVPSAEPYGKTRAVMIPVERFPKTTKQTKEDLQVFNNASGQRSQAQPTPATKKRAVLDDL